MTKEPHPKGQDSELRVDSCPLVVKKIAMRWNHPPSPTLRRDRAGLFDSGAVALIFINLVSHSREQRAWLRNPGAARTGSPPSDPPCVGITRIRFKGSAPKIFFGALSAIWLPRFLSRETKARRAEVKA